MNNKTIKDAVLGDREALIKVSSHLHEIIKACTKHSTKEVAVGLAVIEANRISLIALSLVSKRHLDRVNEFKNNMIAMIKA